MTFITFLMLNEFLKTYLNVYFIGYESSIDDPMTYLCNGKNLLQENFWGLGKPKVGERCVILIDGILYSSPCSVNNVTPVKMICYVK